MSTASRFCPIIVFLCALASGLLLALSLPPYSMSLLGYFAMLPLLVSSRISRPLIAAGSGLLAAAFCAYIVGHPSNSFQYANIVGAFGSLGIVLAFTSIVASISAKRLSWPLWAVLCACSGVAAELFSTQTFPISLAMSQHESAGALRIASCVGVWGVSFLLWLLPASLIALISKQKSAWPVFLCAVGFSAYAVLSPFSRIDSRQMISVAAVQAKDQYAAAEITKKLRGRAKVVVWPEQLMQSADNTARFAAKTNGLSVIASFRGPQRNGMPTNTARHISPEGKTVSVYTKNHLFGRERFEMEKGTHVEITTADGITSGIAICYDTMFTDTSRQLVRKGARIVYVPNSDPDMPNGLFQYMHTAIIPFRAAENGVPIVWSECNGLSMICAGNGKKLAQAPIHKMSSACAQVSPRTSVTLYNRIGDLFAYACLVFVVSLFAWMFLHRKKQL